MNVRYIFLLLALILTLLSCDRPSEQKRKIKLADQSPVIQSGERFTSTIHLEPSMRRAIAVLFFENKTGDPSLEWLQKGLSEMLIRSLSQSSSISVLSTDRIFEIMQQAGQSSTAPSLDFELAAIVSKEADVEAVLTGSIARHGDSLRINVRVFEPNHGKLLREESVEGKSLDAIFTMVDQLTEKIKNALALRLEQQEQARSIAELSTNSLEAWRFYTSGVDFMQKAMNNEAIGQFEKAVAADPSFIVAYYRLCLYLFNQGERQKGHEYFARLKLLRHKATAKEQYQIDRLESGIQRDLRKIIDVSKRWLDVNPQDIDAYFNLGDLYFSLSNYREALRYYQPILAIDPKNKMTYNQIGYCYARLGDIENAVTTLKHYQALAPDEPNPFDSMGDIYYYFGEYQLAEKNLRHSLKNEENFSPSWLTLSNLYLDQGEYNKALEMIWQFLNRAKDPRSKAEGYAQEGLILWRQGKLDEAIACFERFLKNRVSTYRGATWIYELCLEKGDSLGARHSLQNNYAFIRDSLVTREPVFLRDLANLSLWYDINPDASIEIIARQLTGTTSPAVQMWGQFYQALLYLKTNRPDEYKKIAPHFAAEFIGLMKDIREVPFAHETWKSFQFFNRYAYQSIDEGMEKYVQLILYCVNNDLVIPEMIFRSLLVDLFLHHNNQDKALEHMKIIGAPEERQWLVIAPFDNTNGFQKKYPPERETRLNKSYHQQEIQQSWRHPGDGFSEGYINLKQMYKKYNWSVGYGLIYVKSPNQRKVQIRIGTNDSAKLWLNDQEIWRANIGRDAVFDNDIIPAELKPGLNKVLIKVCNRINEWGFYFRVTDETGRGIPEVTFMAAEQISEPFSAL